MAMMIRMLSLMSMSDDEDDDHDGNDKSSKVMTMADRLYSQSKNLLFSKISFQSIFLNEINFSIKSIDLLTQC